VGTKYSSNSTSGYNSVPPSDDGSVTEANKVKYSTIKGKLSDPVKTLADAINAELVTHFDNGPTAVTTNTTLGATHYNKVIQVSGSGVTLTLTDAATLTAGWYCDVVSTDTSNNVALARATASNTINETSADTTVYPLQSIKIMVNAAANGFLVEQKIRHVNGTLSGTTISGTIAGSPTASGAWTFQTGQIFQNSAASTTKIIVRSGTTGQEAAVAFSDGATEKWQWVKRSDNFIGLYDSIVAAYAILQNPNYTITLAYGTVVFDGYGVMTAGTVGLARVQRTEVTNSGSGITIATGTTLTTLDLGSVVAGDRIIVSALVYATKGGTAGIVIASAGKNSGGATVLAYDSFGDLRSSKFVVAIATDWQGPVGGILRVTVSGTLVLSLTATSVGSDSTSGYGAIHAIVLKG